MKRIIAAALLVMCLPAAASAALAESHATGVWRMANGKVTVHLAPCGSNLCGTVIGLTILSNLKPSGDGRWNGTIYNPDDGNTYKSKLRLQNANMMKVEGCVSVFCKSMKFIRVK